MPTFLPRPSALLFLIAGALSAVCGWAQDAGDEASETVVFKQLVFIEQHRASDFLSSGIEEPYDVVVSPDGAHLYAALQKYGNSAVAWFSRDLETGTLGYQGALDKSQLGAGVLSGLRSLALSPDGKHLYGASMFSDSLLGFARDAVSGQLTLQDAIYDGMAGVDGLDGPWSIVVSPDGKHLYVAAFDDDKVSVFSRNATTGRISFQGVYEEGDQGVEELSEPSEIAISPDGQHLYVALYSNQIVTFDRDDASGLLTYSGKLSYLVNEGSKTDSPRALAFSGDGRFLYVASANNDALSVFSRDSENGELVHLEDFKDGSKGISDLDGPFDLVISADGDYLYAASYADDAIVCLERDGETGLLSFSQSIRAGAEDDWILNGPRSIGASPDGEHVYMGSVATPDAISVFRREVLVDPPVLVVAPVSKSIEAGETVAFHALGEGADIGYQWLKDGTEIAGATLPVLALENVSSGDDGSQFQVKVSNPGGYVESDQVALTVLPPIVVHGPVDLTALDVSSVSARLQWTDRSDNETSFEIQRRISGEAFETVGTALANQTSYEDATIVASTSYRYRVRAKRNDTVSLWSNDAVVESLDDVPQPPVNLVVTEQSYNRVSLRWSDRSAVEDGFRIMRRDDQIGSQWAAIGFADKDATTYQDRSASALTTYAYRVQAYNESGYSAFSNSVVAITSEIPVDSIEPISREVEEIAKSGFPIAVSSSKAWEAISDSGWIVVTSPPQGVGFGNEQVSYRVKVNESQEERIGKVIVGGIEHTVIQKGSDPFLRMPNQSTEVGGGGGSKAFAIESNVDWSVSVDSDWINITSDSSDSGHGTVIVSVAANDSFATRSAKVVVSSDSSELQPIEHTINQAGKTAYTTVDSSHGTFAAEGGDGTLRIESNVDWSASVSVSWISFAGEASGSGDASLSFTVEANAGEQRSAQILVNDVPFSVTQAAPEDVVSEVEAPSFLAVDVDYLGASVSWQDNAESELGFILLRTVAGKDDWSKVATLPADATVYRDREAPRGVAVEYRLSAYDAFGESEPADVLSEVLPASGIVALQTRAVMGEEGELFYVRAPLGGVGSWIQEMKPFGDELEGIGFGRESVSTRYQLDEFAGRQLLRAAATPSPLLHDFGLEERWSSTDSLNGLMVSGARESGASARSLGASVRSHLADSDSVIAIGFEIEGDVPLPVLLQGLGPSLPDASRVASDPRIELLALSDSGETALVAENDSWGAWADDAEVSLSEARAKARGLVPASSKEAAMLLMLEQGRYVAVLTVASGSVGAAALEVLDAR
ncbi:beta-propeller fold lactonase family protein [Pelagicoccus sp. SDUM812003]|uniref:beta-propeller fold lactonase family protein n=1 Tax=Pelagicoccus sp. SDUM812003 TaxID=3041267 RepID=UPI0028126B92|nr:beta-propeller fold lactonase family protein [Pelagicoccus sp. SDUM812003]